MTLQEIETKVARRPHSPLFARLADEYLKQSRIDEAKTILESGLHHYPSYATAHLVLARCYHAEQNYSAAFAEIDQVIALLPEQETPRKILEEWDGEFHPVEEVSPPAQPVMEDAGGPIPPPNVSDLEIPQAAGESEYPEEFVTEPSEEAPLAEAVCPDASPVSESGREITEEISGILTEEKSDIEPEPREQREDTIHETAETVDEGMISGDDASVAEIPVGAESMEDVESGSSRDVAPGGIPEVMTGGQPGGPGLGIADLPPLLPQFSEEEMSGEGRIVSKTLAEIYVKQGEFREAVLTYILLYRRNPDRRGEYEQRIRELAGKMQT